VAGLGESRSSRWAAAAVVVSGLVVLGTVALHANSAPTLATQALARTADQANERFFDCLSDQARRLVSPSEPIHIRADGLEQIVYLEGSVGAWASLIPGAEPARATLVMAAGGGPGSCSGYVLSVERTGRL